MSRQNPKSHAPIRAFAVKGGVLHVGGQDVRALAARHDTPLFLYERGFIAAQIAGLRAALPGDVRLHYAVKANPYPPLLDFIAPLVDGFDVASAGELRRALAAGAAEISFAGPGKRDRELAEAIKAGAVINLESAGELARAAKIAGEVGNKARLGVRVNPDFELKASGMHMAGGAKPFGIDTEAVPALLVEIERLGQEFIGFHIFAGSQNLSVDAIADCQRQSLDLALDLAKYAPCPPKVINIGGGFGLPYFPGETHLDIGAVGRNLEALLAARRERLAGAEVVIELGRYLVGEAGVYITRIVDRKISRGEVFLVTDGGLHHQLAASGNFGQVLRRNFPLAIATRMADPAVEIAHVVGCLCTPLDRLGDKMPLPAAKVGDLVAVFLAGAYGLSASPQDFLGHEPAVELLL